MQNSTNQWIWIVVALVIIVIISVLGLTIHRLRRNAALRLLRQRSQQLTDQSVVGAWEEIAQTYPQWLTKKTIDSELVADVWGNGVMVFEYHFPISYPCDDLTQRSLAFEQAINAVAKKARIASSNQKYPPFVVSDCWQLAEQLHIDVAFITNEPTIEYVKDMRKLDSKIVL